MHGFWKIQSADGQHGTQSEKVLSLDQTSQLLFKKELGLRQYGLNQPILEIFTTLVENS